MRPELFGGRAVYDNASLPAAHAARMPRELHAPRPSPSARVLRPLRPRGGAGSGGRAARAPARRRHTARRADRRGGSLRRRWKRPGLSLPPRGDAAQSLDVRAPRSSLCLPELWRAHLRQRGVRGPRPGRGRAAARARADPRDHAHARAARPARAGAGALDRERTGAPRAGARDHARARRVLALARRARAAPRRPGLPARTRRGERADRADARVRDSVPLLRPGERVRQPRAARSARLFQAAKSAG